MFVKISNHFLHFSKADLMFSYNVNWVLFEVNDVIKLHFKSIRRLYYSVYESDVFLYRIDFIAIFKNIHRALLRQFPSYNHFLHLFT